MGSEAVGTPRRRGWRAPSRHQTGRKMLAAMAMASLALAATACGSDSGDASGGAGGSGGDKKTIGITIPNISLQPALQLEVKAAQEVAKAKGYELRIFDPGNDMNKQVDTLRTWIQQDVDAIVNGASQPSVFEGVAKQAMDKGIKWVSYAQELENQDAMIGLQQEPSGKILGELAADWINETLDGKAKVAVLSFRSGQWSRAREKGIVSGLKAKAPGAEIVATQDALSQSEGLKATSTILRAHPDLNVLLAIVDPAAEGAYKAFQNAGHKPGDPKVFIGGIDGSLQALKLLKQGDTMYRGTAALNLEELGRALVEVPDGLLNGEGGDEVVPLEPLTPGDPKIDEYLAVWGNES